MHSLHLLDCHVFHFPYFPAFYIWTQSPWGNSFLSNLCQEIRGKFIFGTVALNSNSFSCFSNLHEINMRERGGWDKGNLMIVLKLQNLTSVEHELFWDHSLCVLISIFFSFQFEKTVYHCLAENQLILLYKYITMKQQTMSTQSRHSSRKIFFSNLRRFGWLGYCWLQVWSQLKLYFEIKPLMRRSSSSLK